MNHSIAPRVAWALWAATAALFAGSVGLLLARPPDSVPTNLSSQGLEAGLLAVFLTVSVVGLAVALRRSDNVVGWLFLAWGLVAAGSQFALLYAIHTSVAAPGSLPAGDWFAWVSAWTPGALFAPMALLFLFFPDGRLPSRRWRSVAWLAAGGLVVSVVGIALAPGPLIWSVETVANPVGLPGAGFLAGVGDLGFAAVAVSILAAATAPLVRLRRSEGLERQQLKWLGYGTVVAVAALGLLVGVHFAMGKHAADVPLWSQYVGLLGLAVLPLSAGIAILRHGLFDIDRLIRRSLIYGGLWAAIAAGYVGLAALAGIAAGDRLPLSLAVLVAVAASVAFAPARRGLSDLAARRVYGDRLTSHELLKRFGQALESAFDPSELAPRLAEMVRRGLGLSWARVQLNNGDGSPQVGTAGLRPTEAPAGERTVPLLRNGEQVGEIVCGPKLLGGFTSADHALLESLARQAALALAHIQLTAELAAQAKELAASRARLVQAQDAERRRIERDLHDGVQQELIALTIKLDLARRQLAVNPEAVEKLLVDLRTQTTQALDDLRDLVHGIYPPVLTDHGLIAAIEAKTSRLPVPVAIDAAPDTRRIRYPEPVETAAYFIVSESLTNALKHAHANRAQVRIGSTSDWLEIEVIDDGIGFDPAMVTGSGLTGMRDRIEALGGSLTVSSASGAGTAVSARLPATPADPATPSARTMAASV
ncbi:MAG: histidine kinase [Actinomycetota bacterium]|nr:histidine kinase [Actinomycetota bacterium]